jgi:hypothetical protein
MYIGKIVKSDSQTNYVCQIYGRLEVELEPSPADYVFGRFVRVATPKPPRLVHVETEPAPDNYHESIIYLVGVIYNTLLVNPDFSSFGPRIASSEFQTEIFSPDYVSETAVLVHLIALGMGEMRITNNGEREFNPLMQGVPPLSPKLGGEVETMGDDEVRAFHFFSDSTNPGSVPYLYLGYLPHIIAQHNSLIPLVILRIIDQLERLLPQHLTILSIVKRDFAWRLKVLTTG